MALEDLKKDKTELDTLLASATRQRVKDVLIKAKAEVDREIINLEMKEKIAAERHATASANKRYLKELVEYAWEQSDKFVKIYVTLEGVQKVDESQVTCTYTENSVKILVSNLNGQDYGLTVNNLCEQINIEGSYRVIKTDMVIVYMKKSEVGKKWEFLTTIDKRLNKQKQTKPDFSEDNDVQGSLIKMLKDMYDKGDAQTKQAIGKAWAESQKNMFNAEI